MENKTNKQTEKKTNTWKIVLLVLGGALLVGGGTFMVCGGMSNFGKKSDLKGLGQGSTSNQNPSKGGFDRNNKINNNFGKQRLGTKPVSMSNNILK